jgi:dipeptidyl aminopeptidase/acylaminoacyl peptidase
MMNRRDIVDVDLATRRKRVSPQRRDRRREPAYSPDGAFSSSVVRHRALVQRPGSLTLLDAARRANARSRRARPRADARRVVRRTRSAALHRRGSRPRRSVAARRSTPRSAERSSSPAAAIGSFSQSRDGRVIAFDRASAQHPPALFACRGDGSGERSIDTLNRALLARTRRRRARRARSRAGRRARADVRSPTRRTSIRRGSGRCCRRSTAARTPRISTAGTSAGTTSLRGQGYVVAAVNYHGSSGFGQKWLETITGRYGEKEFADVEAGPTGCCARATSIDAARGDRRQLRRLHGRVHERPHRPLQAFVCHAGCYDWVSMMATDGYQFFADELGAFHWEQPARVMQQSPHHYVKRAKTPTLVMHGEQDFRVPATQALQYYDTLKAKNVPARLVYFPDENHWILKPQNSRCGIANSSLGDALRARRARAREAIGGVGA